MLSNSSLLDSRHTLSAATTIGRTAPLGATIERDVANFSAFSRKATAVEILFFDREDDAQPTAVVRIDPITNRTYHYWHVFVPSICAGQLYGYRFHGPFDPAAGMRFECNRITSMILKFSLETNIPPPCPIALLRPTIGFGHPAEACISATTLETGRKLGALARLEGSAFFAGGVENHPLYIGGVIGRGVTHQPFRGLAYACRFNPRWRSARSPVATD